MGRDVLVQVHRWDNSLLHAFWFLLGAHWHVLLVCARRCSHIFPIVSHKFRTKDKKRYSIHTSFDFDFIDSSIKIFVTHFFLTTWFGSTGKWKY